MNKKILILLISMNSSLSMASIQINNDYLNFNTFGNLEQGFGSKFDYKYKNTKLKGKTSVNIYNDKKTVAFDSLYAENQVNLNTKMRVGKLPLIDDIDYFKLGQDINYLGEQKINNYEGLNIIYNTSIGNHTLFSNNIIGRYENTANNIMYYENILGSSLTIKNDLYKIRFGHSIIEPDIDNVELNYFDVKGTLSSFEFNYKNDYFSHSNEYIKKVYSTEKIINSFDTKIEYLKLGKIKPYSKYKIEVDQFNTGNKKILSGFDYKTSNNFILSGYYERKIEIINDSEPKFDNIFNIGVNFHY